MSSNRNSIGNAGAILLATLTADGQDTGPLLYQVHPAGTQPYDYSLIRACSQLMLGLGGTGTGLSVTVYFTTDVATANGTSAAPVWFRCPSPSTENANQWSNPMQNINGFNALEFKGRAIALRAVATTTVPGVAPVGAVSLYLLGGF